MQSIIHRDSDPPRVEFPARYNAAHDLLSRPALAKQARLCAGRYRPVPELR